MACSQHNQQEQALTWYMNFTENQTRSKNDIKQSFLTFFKTQDVKHLVAQNLKEIRKNPRDSMCEYDKRFNDLLNKIPYIIEETLLVKWFVVGLLHKIIAPLRMHEILTYEDAIKKYQWLKSDADQNTLLVNQRIEEKIEMMQKTIRDLSLRNVDLCCTLSMMTKGHKRHLSSKRGQTPRSSTDSNGILL